MCSIPGLPTPGSEVPVLITRVNLNPTCGLVVLWVNLDDSRKHIYETLREEIQIPQRKFYATEGKPGDLCLVCISDTWHRARIVSVETETFNVFLIDQGKPHIATSEALAWGHCDSFVLPPEIESCILANVLSLENNQPDKANKFLTSLPGKRFKGLVQHVLMPDRMIVLDIPIVSRHMCKLGSAQKIPVDEFKSLLLKCLHLPKEESSEDFNKSPEQNLKGDSQLSKQYFYPELLMDALEIVTVTEVTDPLNIFCKLQIFFKAIKTLSEQIHQYYETCTDSEEAQPQTCGEPCAAKGTNGRWHRSMLKQNILACDGTVEVLHVDEGKTELIPVGDIKPLLVKFLRMPVVTYRCSLNEIKDDGREWTVDETNFLKSLLLNQTVIARFDHKTEPQDVYCVTLCGANAECISSCFMEKAGLIPHSRPDLNMQNGSINSTFLTSIGDENKLNRNVDELLEETKNKVINSSTDDASTSATNAIHIKRSSKYQNHNGHLSTGFPSEEYIACGDNVFTVGSTVNVKVTCIEGQHKFWCQTTENGDSLQRLMKDIQNHYTSARPRPLTESICVARHPDNSKWYRARIIANRHSPTVDVRFIDYGQIQKVPLQDVQLIDPVFLQLKAQAFQCCLCNQRNPTDVTLQNADLIEFQKCVDFGTSTNIEVKCVVKAVTSDDEGLLLNMVDIETASDSASKLLAQKCAQSDVYNYSTHNIEVGAKEKVWVTSSENVGLFYCQLFRNCHWFDKVMENVAQLLDQPQCSDQPLGLKSICLAKYSDDQWYRGQVVEMSPKLKVHFVDYGDTLEVNETQIRSCPTEATMIRSIPMQAVPLGLFDIPAEILPEVNQWFADHAVGHNFTISVVAQEEKGKFIVELFDGSLNVNEKVREKMAKIKQQLTDQQFSNSSKLTTAPDVPQELVEASELTKTTQQNRVQSMVARDDLQMGSQSTPDTSTPKSFDEGNKPALDAIIESKENVAETSVQSFHNDSEVSQVLKDEMYVSCIVGPNYFWCQYSNAEDLNTVSKLAQEAGQVQQDRVFLESLEPGSSCLALFSSDNLWYRARVIRKDGNTLHVVFIDYGNESEVDIENIRPLPQRLLDIAPQAFLCYLKEFNESKGSWNDEVYDDFYNLLIDKPLKVTIFNMKNHSEIAVSHYAVEIECDKVVINRLMQKYWRPFSTEQSRNETSLVETQDTEPGGNVTHCHVFKDNTSTCKYKRLSFSKNKAEMVHASSIVEPYFFWCQYTKTEELCKVIQLAQEAGQLDQDIKFAETLGPGSPCLARFSSDNQWYRAQVIRRVNDAFCVLFVDYGNESEVDIKDVRSVPQTLLEIAPQAFLCRLNGFDESKGSWDDKASDGFYNLLVDKPLKLTVFSMEDHPEIELSQFSVEIDYDGVVVNAAMQKYWNPLTEEYPLMENPQSARRNGSICVYKEPIISKSKTEMVYASCIAEPHFFWCQYINTEDLCKVIQLAQEAGQSDQDMILAETLGPGSPCLALFSSDNQWHRAQVMQKTGNTLHVLFVDYGNESEVDIKDVRSLPQTLLEIAPQAFLCCLYGFDESQGSWDDQVYDDFYNLLINQQLKVTVCNMEDHPEIVVPQYAVKIEYEGVVINAAVQKYWKPVTKECLTTENSQGNESSCTYKEPRISINKSEMVHASCIVEPHYFWCQYTITEDLCKVIQEAGESDQDMTLTETLGPGSPCLALFSSDNQWYRAQVIQKTGNTLHVVFVDYGNESEVDIKDVRSVPQSLLEISPQAFLCRLNGFDELKGSWDDETSADFYNLLVDKPLKLTVLNVEDHSKLAVPQHEVVIECEGVLVNAAMQKYWMPATEECAMTKSPQTEILLKDSPMKCMVTHRNESTCKYKEPSISKNRTEMVYASCIAEPHFFWCQYINTEDLCKVIQLAQEAGQSDQDITFAETLGPGSPCLALFSSDNQWYRAQVMRKTDNALHVLFVDYGNESEVDIKDVQSLPQSLLEIAPQAFLCCLNGFDESKGSWQDEVYDDFYNLLIDKQLKVTVFSAEDHSKIAVPHYAVEIECEGAIVNTLMEKYWKGKGSDGALAENLETVDRNETRTVDENVEV